MKRTTPVARVGQYYYLPRPSGAGRGPVCVVVREVDSLGDATCDYVRPVDRVGEGVYFTSTHLIDNCYRATPEQAKRIAGGMD